MAWTDEMIETLKNLWDQGVSTGEIGKRLGVTKNSVVGKVHRLKLIGRPSPIKRSADKEEKPAKKEAPAKEIKVEKLEKPKKVEKLEKPKKIKEIAPAQTKQIEQNIDDIKIIKAKENVVIAPSTRKDGGYNLVELGISSCRWPIGDPKDENFHFCGKRAKTGQTYCDEHSQIAYVKIVKK